MLIALVSAKGAPGVTSAAMALSATSGGIMVELDPSGGSVDCWLRSTGEPTLVPTASALRRQADSQTIVGFAQAVVPGVRVIRAPTPGPVAESTIAGIAGRLVPLLGGSEMPVFIDGGRWSRTQPSARRIEGCDVGALVCSPTIEGVEAARSQLDHLARLVDRVAVIAVGERPYHAKEIADAVRAPVATLAWDRRGLARLLEVGASRGWARTGIARSTGAVLDQLAIGTPDTDQSTQAQTQPRESSGDEARADQPNEAARA